LKNVKITTRQAIVLFLCVVTLVSFFQPAVRLNFSIIGIERGVNLSLATFFESGDGLIDLNLADTDFASLFDDSDVMVDVGLRVVFSVAAYFATLLGMTAVLFFTFFGRFRRAVVVLTVVSFGLMLAAGRVVLTLPPLVNQILNDTIQRSVILRFIALFIDTTDIIGLQLQRGYWLIVVPLGMLVLLEGFYTVTERGKKR